MTWRLFSQTDFNSVKHKYINHQDRSNCWEIKLIAHINTMHMYVFCPFQISVSNWHINICHEPLTINWQEDISGFQLKSNIYTYWKSNNTKEYLQWMLSPPLTLIINFVHFPINDYYQLSTYPSRNILYTQNHTILLRMIYAHLLICTHVCINPSKQSSNVPRHKHGFAASSH